MTQLLVLPFFTVWFSLQVGRVSKHQKVIYICDKCQVSYGSCEKFKEHSVNVGHLNKAHLRSNDHPLARGISSEDGDNAISFLTSGSIVAIVVKHFLRVTNSWGALLMYYQLSSSVLTTY